MACNVSPQDGPLCTPVSVCGVQSDAIQGALMQCVETCDTLVGSMLLLDIANELAKKIAQNPSCACHPSSCKLENM